jgi:hypothetical protein
LNVDIVLNQFFDFFSIVVWNYDTDRHI